MIVTFVPWKALSGTNTYSVNEYVAKQLDGTVYNPEDVEPVYRDVLASLYLPAGVTLNEDTFRVQADSLAEARMLQFDTRYQAVAQLSVLQTAITHTPANA